MKFTVEVEDNKTCSVLIGDQAFDSWKVPGLTPEQATVIKRGFELVFRNGMRTGLRHAFEALREAERKIDTKENAA